MNNRKFIIGYSILVISLVLLSIQFVTAQNIDAENSQINFTIKNFGINTVKGTVSDLQGEVRFDPNQLAQSKIDVSVAVSTLQTGIKKRDEHLMKDDFFAAETYPRISFSSSEIKAKGNKFIANGSLTIRGVSQEVSIPFSAEEGEKRILRGDLTINRKDFKVGEDTSSFTVGDEVKISIVCSLTPAGS
ncbi:MAG: YceI family protein [Bacteroidota bacterium]